MSGKKQRGSEAERRRRRPKKPSPAPKTLAEFSRYIRGRVVDISDASDFFKKSWEIYRSLVATHVSERGSYRYELSEAFLNSFFRELRNATRGHTRLPYKIAGPNLVAEMLCLAAYAGSPLDVIDELPFDYEFETDVWASSRLISEAWARLGKLPVPGPETAILVESEPGKDWRLGDRRSQAPRVGVTLQYNEDRNGLPALTLEVVGEPVCLLMRAKSTPPDPDKRKLAREEAERLWNSLVWWSRAAVGVGELEGGRPATGRGWQAAFLHDHERLSWAQVARRLCPSEHRHTTACRDNYRQQAKQYWHRIRKQVQRVTTAKA